MTTIQRIVLILFILYILAMLFLLVASNSYRGHNVWVGGFTPERWLAYVAGSFNLVPLRGITEQIGFIVNGVDVTRNAIYLVGNIVGFAPLGFFLPELFSRLRQFKAFFIAIAVAVTALELVQLMTMRGAFDIDDILLNVMGACLGFLIMTRRQTK
jgi:glycopeptide antibiotics resistance protein